MDGLSVVLWTTLLSLIVSTSVQGSFSFNDASLCCQGGNLKLLWNYKTDETVTVIEWYRQPGNLIARIFGVSIGAPFTVLSPYNTTIVKDLTSRHNGSIQINGVSSKDDGVYSVNVTATSPQSSILPFNSSTCPRCNTGTEIPPEDNNKTGLIIGCTIAAVVVVVCVGVTIYIGIYMRKRKGKELKKEVAEGYNKAGETQPEKTENGSNDFRTHEAF